MDHSHIGHNGMNHGGMDHGGDSGHDGMGHGDMDMGKCSMNMLFTWSTKNLCIIFEQWRVTGPWSLLISLAAIVFLTAAYERIRDATRRFEISHEAYMASFGAGSPNENATLLGSSSSFVAGKGSREAAERRGKIIKAALYALQVSYSFFIMLLFMTYNGWVMLAVAAGAFIGYLSFSADSPATKTVACH